MWLLLFVHLGGWCLLIKIQITSYNLFMISMESYSIRLSCSAVIYTINGQVDGNSLRNDLSSEYQHVRTKDRCSSLICLIATDYSMLARVISGVNLCRCFEWSGKYKKYIFQLRPVEEDHRTQSQTKEKHLPLHTSLFFPSMKTNT